ncbi:acyltransferase family protein [Bosea sp. 685]|uniref:acyltransferase family protein n=1 Tax=Bosea sp. 685 TaxID=3080057 RepID=UPI002892B7D1|nr:acyltransferase family protein [Bosea sp. 685]WNJ89195.1 acyltransferase family protein [Bosea sp. 685]
MLSATQASSSARAAPGVALLDVARGLAMVIVLYGHALEIFFLRRPDGVFLHEAFVQYKVLASFVMPLFFLVSGAAAAKLPAKGWRNVVKTSLYLILLAYLVHMLGLIGLAADALLGGEGNLLEIGRSGFEAMLKGRNFSTIVVWFLVSLALVRLIAYAVFSRFPRAIYAVIALAALASLLVPVLPNAFLMKSWFTGLVFFALGMALAGQLKRPAWLAVLPLAPLLAWLALANRGCVFDPVRLCPPPNLPAEAVVWMHNGETGFLPLFYAAGLLGCALALALVQLLVRFTPRGGGVTPLFGVTSLLAGIGRRSLDLLVINGFVLVFLQPELKAISLPEIEPWFFPVLLFVVVALHLALLRLLKRPLSALQRLASRGADLAVAGLAVMLARSGRAGGRSVLPSSTRS